MDNTPWEKKIANIGSKSRISRTKNAVFCTVLELAMQTRQPVVMVDGIDLIDDGLLDLRLIDSEGWSCNG